MADLRKYFCCTDNLTGSKIIGGIQIILNINFVLNFMQLTRPEDDSGRLAIAFILILVAYGLSLLGKVQLLYDSFAD